MSSMVVRQIAYGESRVNVDCTATAEASAVKIVEATPVCFDGATEVICEFGFCAWGADSTTIVCRLALFQEETSIGRIMQARAYDASLSSMPGMLRRHRLTPPAGWRTYSVRGFVSAAGTFRVAGDIPGPGRDNPAFLRILQVTPRV